MTDTISKSINPENIDVPGLVKVLEGMEERLAKIEEVLEMDDRGYRMMSSSEWWAC
jgi:hypothetical protein